MASYALNTDINGKIAADANSLNNLKYAARDNSPESIKAAAVQFEALMINMMLKSMRDATPKESMFDSEQSRTFLSMLDQQLSQQMAARGTGLADMLARQLQGRLTSVPPEALDSLAGSPEHPPLNPGLAAGNTSQPLPTNAHEFVQQMRRHAEAASQDSGIPAHLMLGQAALETGWGKRQITGTDGTASHNLFGIKAGPSWKGKTVEALTTEYINGMPQKRIETFRAYDSYADSFRDFANMMRNNPRYGNVMENTGSAASYAQAMQEAGYATDPQYASKLRRVIENISAA
ncbi:flagellar assembly peptidoglycan hydrolase FlgJ [Methylobacillus flagellatus]|uniref:Peptidoglycan hydrolase FlgJ n=1 Tax=Methylobacillus flagellatus (strain ATCC 51484 / DSM 6875 / VKM B-1610 / KT) TaxID=265072 RepID=Q1GZV8_METFK|nr:flagellar assembly peptidoglycan hydrolase FlgJ [Methylobacillus flagellatus]ABE50229.1 Mannosyl-glycoprotein endo-beta-N-acetylglucosamidase [Methylobacillus flagellatus KT]